MVSPVQQRLLKHQGYHLLVWFVIGGFLCWEIGHFNRENEHIFRTWTPATWVCLSWIFAALHQGWILFFWRLELHGKQISSWFGVRGFLIFRVGFVLFALVRFLAIIPISLETPQTAPLPRWLSLGLLIVTTPPILWGLFCVFMFFGATRAFGADHFDADYRGGNLETRGIFKYIPNTMYTVILLALYHPGLLVHSRLGLITAAAHHLFVWTHYFCTEKPDMQEIYGSQGPQRSRHSAG